MTPGMLVSCIHYSGVDDAVKERSATAYTRTMGDDETPQGLA